MSRETQYIGLTKRAQMYVKNLTPANEILTNYTYGMFDEIIHLGSWKHPEKGTVREVVQETPWSSGMMIFTCLAWDFGNTVERDPETGEDTFVVDNTNTMFEWIHNPECTSEYDVQKGEMWV